MSLLERLLQTRITQGSLVFVDHNGKKSTFGHEGEPIVIKFNRSNTLRRILRNPMLRLGECYVDGEFDIVEGTLTDFLRLLRVNLTDYVAKGRSIPGSFASLLQPINSITESLKNVSHHYNLEDSLYKGFLDEDMHYSCAYFKSDSATLEEAQQAKCEHLMKKLCLEPGQRVLDIGSGWGSLAMFLAEHAQVSVTGITLSTSQLRVAEERANERNLSNQVQFELEDYRQHQGEYDAIVSVGMFEHVGKRNYHTYFDKVKRLLKPDGVACIHTIGSSESPTPTNPWIKRYIFPGGYIPSLSEVNESVEASGLVTQDIEVWRRHYAQTLQAWHERFQSIRERILNEKGEKFCRMWEFYLCACQTAFELDSLVVFQIQLGHRNDSAPLARDYLHST